MLKWKHLIIRNVTNQCAMRRAKIDHNEVVHIAIIDEQCLVIGDATAEEHKPLRMKFAHQMLRFDLNMSTVEMKPFNELSTVDVVNAIKKL